MNNEALPATLSDAMAAEPMWLMVWVYSLLIVHLLAIPFVVGKDNGQWTIRYRPVAIILGFVVSGLFMNWLFAQYGYVRLLGAAHFIGWLPAFIYVYIGLGQSSNATLYGRYLRLYLLIAGICLFIDAIDLVRYLMGDGELGTGA